MEWENPEHARAQKRITGWTCVKSWFLFYVPRASINIFEFCILECC